MASLHVVELAGRREERARIVRRTTPALAELAAGPNRRHARIAERELVRRARHGSPHAAALLALLERMKVCRP